jgi:nitrogen regulatory protein PII
MKRIEVVLDNSALECFRDLAPELNIVEFEATEVRRSSTLCHGRQRVFRGQAYTLDLPVRTKIGFLVADEDVERIVRGVAGAVRPDSISIVSIDQIDLADLAELGSNLLRSESTNPRPIAH